MLQRFFVKEPLIVFFYSFIWFSKLQVVYLQMIDNRNLIQEQMKADKFNIYGC